jgi:hypothetical protein
LLDGEQGQQALASTDGLWPKDGWCLTGTKSGMRHWSQGVGTQDLAGGGGRSGRGGHTQERKRERERERVGMPDRAPTREG